MAHTQVAFGTSLHPLCILSASSPLSNTHNRPPTILSPCLSGVNTEGGVEVMAPIRRLLVAETLVRPYLSLSLAFYSPPAFSPPSLSPLFPLSLLSLRLSFLELILH